MPAASAPALPLSLRRRFLLACDCALTRSLAGARVGVRALAASRQVAPVAQSTIGLNVNQPLDVHGDVFAQIAFDLAFVLNHLADAVYLVFTEILDFFDRVYVGCYQDAQGARVTDSENVGQRDSCLLVAGKVDACNTCHNGSFLLLARSGF